MGKGDDNEDDGGDVIINSRKPAAKKRSNNNTQRRRPRRGKPHEDDGIAVAKQDDEAATNNNKMNGANKKKGSKKNNSKKTQQQQQNNNSDYPPHWSLETCLQCYHDTTAADAVAENADTTAPSVVIRGKLRVLPGNDKTAMGFVACDRGFMTQDVVIPDMLHRNRAMDGDLVFVQVLGPIEMIDDEKKKKADEQPNVELLSTALETQMKLASSQEEEVDEGGDAIVEEWHYNDDDETEDVLSPPRTWQDDEIQMDLWNPQVSVVRHETLVPPSDNHREDPSSAPKQQRGRVVYVVPPKEISSELEPATSKKAPLLRPRRRIVGSLRVLQSGTILLTPNNKSLPQFKCPQEKTQALIDKLQKEYESENEKGNSSSSSSSSSSAARLLDTTLFQAEYEYGSWKESHKNWPPCTNVQKLGDACVLEDEIQALLCEYQVDHGDFPTAALHDVDHAVQSGVYVDNSDSSNKTELGWKPTPEMYKGRRDYRKQRIFTIDPTTAKDLDDALHITPLPDGSIEVGVHIADVSAFVHPGTAVDEEAMRRATTVYLVDRTVPMLPRPLCEVACSLNENVERLAFSCVWRMNADGTLRLKSKKGKNSQQEDVWYGRTVIKSCARLDYSTAQNIIENKVARPGERDEDADETMWPLSRRPTGGHTMQQVAADVRLMHKVAMARRRLRFDNGALALQSVKLTFQLDTDGQTPLLAAPYPIRDSNRLVEEYMLLANYLVAQRLITHAKDRALLRYHPPPLMSGLDKVVAVAKASMDFDVDVTSSQSLHESLIRLGRICNDPLVLKCVTQMMTLPMQQAEYFAAGTEEPEMWRHFALNMPYYTHFTSPIRRYPDVMVHRLLQATIDGEEALDNFPQNVTQIQQICTHCCDKQKASKEAQQRCDRVFLALYLKSHLMKGQMGVVLSVGQKAFTVYLPDLGADALLYLEEHKDILTWASEERKDGTRRILLQQKPNVPGKAAARRWNTLEINVFTKLIVTVVCKESPPIDIKLRLEGPWTG